MTIRIRPTILVDCRCEVGEGPVYDPYSDTLFWVDIPLGRFWRCELSNSNVTYRDIGEPLGSIALVEGGGFLLAAMSGLYLLPRWLGVPKLLQQVKSDLSTQFNDGKCDARGRLIIGTCAADPQFYGSLFRIDHDGTAHRLIRNLRMSNGMDWSPDNKFFFHVDSLAQTVTRYRWDEASGVPHSPVPFVTIPSTEGLPDGLSVDGEGFLWLAVWGAGEVRCYDPTGRAVDVVKVPTPNVSSCAFGGPKLSELYITTAARGAPERDGADSVAGNVFVVETTTNGQARASLFHLECATP